MVDPARLVADPSVPSSTTSAQIDVEDVAEYRAMDSHVAVGVTNENGEVLLADDGSHGFGLPARPVDGDVNWNDSATELVEDLFGTSAVTLAVRSVRRHEFRVAETDERLVVESVVYGAEIPNDELADPDPAESRFESMGWYSSVPSAQEGAMAEDVRRFV